jgi:integrase
MGRLEDFGLTKVKGKGGDESGVPLPKVALEILAEYITHERAEAGENDPLFVFRYRTKGGAWCERRMADHRIWKLVKAIGKRFGVRQLHPHAFRRAAEADARNSACRSSAPATHRHSDDDAVYAADADGAEGSRRRVRRGLKRSGFNPDTALAAC